jgi:GAF domain-containing protein
VVNRQARIALDVGQEAVHFQNPYLPDTRSEMALPLISRDQAIGALTVQSVARSAFSTEDITALQTMADQLANAITNARLYEASRRATRREALIKEITAKVRANTDITGILQTTITEIGAAVGGQRAYIYLTPPPNNNE